MYMKEALLMTCAGAGFMLLMTCLGAFTVFIFGSETKLSAQRFMSGFSGGVMIAASVWSMIIPALDIVGGIKGVAIISFGIAGGAATIAGADALLCKYRFKGENESIRKRNSLLMLAVTLHNIPEGMAVGLSFAIAATTGEYGAALTLALCIGIQNFPEGAAISLPMRREGMTKAKSALKGCATGLVEPPAAILAVLLSTAFASVMPLMLSFAAGAMLYVTAEELIPESNGGGKYGTAGLIFGFIMMFALDVILG